MCNKHCSSKFIYLNIFWTVDLTICDDTIIGLCRQSLFQTYMHLSIWSLMWRMQRSGRVSLRMQVNCWNFDVIVVITLVFHLYTGPFDASYYPMLVPHLSEVLRGVLLCSPVLHVYSPVFNMWTLHLCLVAWDFTITLGNGP